MSDTQQPPQDRLAPWRSLRELHLLEWTTAVKNSLDTAIEATKTAAEFGRVGIQSAFILNGGALAALPAIAEYLRANRSGVGSEAITFTVGLAAIAFCTIVAYGNFSLLGWYYARDASAASERLSLTYDAIHAGKMPPAPARWPDKLQPKIQFCINATMIIALVLAVISFCAFLKGAFDLIALAHVMAVPARHA